MIMTKSAAKSLMLPAAMAAGALFYRWMGYLTFLSPYLIFIMLTITYCRVKPSEFRPKRFQWHLLSVQMALAAVAYFALVTWDRTLAEGVFICVFIPTATAAPVITGMLGGSISALATYSLLCNVFVAVAGPVVLAAVGEHSEMSFLQSFLMICRNVFPLLILPIIVALGMERLVPKAHAWLVRRQELSFYIWAVSLFIVVGSSVSFAINRFTPGSAMTMVLLALGALVVCILQFAAGRRVGHHFGDTVSGGQGLGQKNTLLAIWIALTYLNPIASIAPAAYVAWQNIINSWQLILHERHKHQVLGIRH